MEGYKAGRNASSRLFTISLSGVLWGTNRICFPRWMEYRNGDSRCCTDVFFAFVFAAAHFLGREEEEDILGMGFPGIRAHEDIPESIRALTT